MEMAAPPSRLGGKLLGLPVNSERIIKNMRKQQYASFPVARVANRIILGHWYGVRESIRRNALSIKGVLNV